MRMRGLLLAFVISLAAFPVPAGATTLAEACMGVPPTTSEEIHSVVKSLSGLSEYLNDSEVEDVMRYDALADTTANVDVLADALDKSVSLLESAQERRQAYLDELAYAAWLDEVGDSIATSAREVPSPGSNYCAMWVSQVYAHAGLGYIGGNACDQYHAWCWSSDIDELKVGMIVAVPSHPHTYMGSIYGHVGIYVGDGEVMDNVGYVRTIALDEWLSYYGETQEPRWGFAADV